jgi:hypothetical protein
MKLLVSVSMVIAALTLSASGALGQVPAQGAIKFSGTVGICLGGNPPGPACDVSVDAKLLPNGKAKGTFTDQLAEYRVIQIVPPSTIFPFWCFSGVFASGTPTHHFEAWENLYLVDSGNGSSSLDQISMAGSEVPTGMPMCIPEIDQLISLFSVVEGDIVVGHKSTGNGG